MPPLSTRLLFPFCLGASLGLFAACQGEPPALQETSAWTTRSFAQDEEGWPTQGRLLHGSELESVSFLKAAFEDTGELIQDLRLEKGELVGEVTYRDDSGSPVLSTCAVTPTTGVNRNCGFSWKGVGSCTPQSSVHLGAGGCGLGTCSGNAVLRVCPGTQPCVSANAIASGDNGCNGSLCPDVTFTCPASGTYTVLAGAWMAGQPWSARVEASSGKFPARRVLRGAELIGARLFGTSVKNPQHDDMTVVIEDVLNANQVVDEGRSPPTWWDGSGNTFLYKMKMKRQDEWVTCSNVNGGPNSDWMVPVSGVYDEDTGARDTSDPTRFTLGCHHDVIAKCYRWGYQPWKDGLNPGGTGNMGDAHAVCTRMARADYCGNGGTQTQEGTHITFWDHQVNPTVFTRPDADDILPQEIFEAGWNRSGAVCLSHARWKTLPPPPIGCPLIAPSLLPDGSIAGDCKPGEKWHNDVLCPTVCNTPEEALNYEPSTSPIRLFNHSAIHGADGGTPSDGGVPTP
ncbi:ADYC domain-containing protein [Melittangium boletus]|uniref:ADYC domain-containing protein n=1 Tax=Melittangium boletus DSM 14713 TaxID=1294270 RepID=A0A250IF40_9BACT|nr:ADYC domain-containing protein [Melittangium boletus]ATB30375.1 hypothetical protein MEBOL_003836 [Melittangium boletus DSM 14713]